MSAPGAVVSLAERILARSGNRPAIALVDGRSGSGKTVLAEQLATIIGAQVLHLDDLYAGWDGLVEGSRAVRGALQSGRYRRYDWKLGTYAEEVVVDPTRPLIVEGCGALTRSNLAAAKFRAGEGRPWSVWMECPAALRRDRALARDGEMFRPHWAQWAAQELTHLRTALPVALAVEVLHSR